MFNISFIDRLLFAEHLALMIKAGLPLREGVVTIQEQTRSKRFKKILKDIVKRLDNGEPLGKTLALYPKSFDDFFVNIINIGEESGTLDKNLEYLAFHLKKNNQIKRKIIAAMIYPAIVLLATFGLGSALAVFILPKLIPLFKSLKVELPLSAKILLFISELIENYGIFIFFGIIALLISLFLISRLRPIKLINHSIILKAPISRKIVRFFNLAVFSRTLGILIKSGVPIVGALNITFGTLNNLIYQNQIKKLILKVEKGEKISDNLAKTSLFPSTFSRVIEVGEKTGNLENSLLYLADYYEQEVDNTSQRLSIILEPILLITIGLVVGFIAISIITPIYQITRGLQQ
ncbi:hypothetical protein AMJ47_01065 [Parcubacteria bacterium DG_72]|nr:MAG: hypothetical protein AMJ47_01065 [Parcubacteria bacterium DG_72]